MSERLVTYTLDETADRWEACAARLLARPDATHVEHGLAVAYEGCAAELRAIMAAAREAHTDEQHDAVAFAAQELRHIGPATEVLS